MSISLYFHLFVSLQELVENLEVPMGKKRLVRQKEMQVLPAHLHHQKLQETHSQGFLMTVKSLRRERKRRRAAMKR